MKQPRTIYVRPAPGMRVRDPHTKQVLPEEGATKPRDSYWERRVLFGDCLEGPAETPAPPQPTEAAAPEIDQPAPRRSRRHTEE